MNLALLRADLMQDEAVKFIAYKDSLGYWTIGVGHLLGGSPRMSQIEPDECEALLDLDIRKAEAAARRLVPQFDALSDSRQRALVNMTFNRGERRMRESTTILPAIRKGAETGDWSGVRPAIVASEWASQVGARALRLADMFEAA